MFLAKVGFREAQFAWLPFFRNTKDGHEWSTKDFGMNRVFIIVVLPGDMGNNQLGSQRSMHSKISISPGRSVDMPLIFDWQEMALSLLLPVVLIDED